MSRTNKALWQAVLALFLGGFTTYSLMYCTQPLLPIFSAYFQVTPMLASLSLSVTLAGVIVGMLAAPQLSKRWGRKRIMSAALLTAAVLEGLAALSPQYEVFLALRSLQGLALAGFPANAMAYVMEEFPPHQAGIIMGLYISGTTVGGMMGRLSAGWFTSWYSWRVALFLLAVIAALAAIWFVYSLPRSQHQGGQGGKTLGLMESLRRAIKERQLMNLYACGFLLMGSFVTLFNYISYLLMAEPYNLSPAAIGSLFLLNAVGTMIAPLVGRLAALYSHGAVLIGGVALMLLGCLVTLAAPFEIKLAGMILFSGAFAANHTTISGWVGRCATFDKAQASAWYLTFYYAGSVIAGTAGGRFWSRYAWPGVVGMIVAMLIVALMLVLRQQKSVTDDQEKG